MKFTAKCLKCYMVGFKSLQQFQDHMQDVHAVKSNPRYAVSDSTETPKPVFKLVHIGWDVCDVVGFKTEWCEICAKARSHEIYNGWMICLACTAETEATKPEAVA